MLNLKAILTILFTLIVIAGLVFAVIATRNKSFLRSKADLETITLPYQLTSGWNLLGLPFDITTTLTPTELFNKFSNSCIAVAEFLNNSNSYSYSYSSYYSNPGQTSTLTQLVGGKNYFVYCPQAPTTQASISGNRLKWDQLLPRLSGVVTRYQNLNYYFIPLPNDTTATTASAFLQEASQKLSTTTSRVNCVRLYRLNSNHWENFDNRQTSTDYNLSTTSGYILNCEPPVEVPIATTSPTPSPVVTASPTPSPTTSPTPSPTPSPAPTPSPTASPTPSPVSALTGTRDPVSPCTDPRLSQLGPLQGVVTNTNINGYLHNRYDNSIYQPGGPFVGFNGDATETEAVNMAKYIYWLNHGRANSLNDSGYAAQELSLDGFTRAFLKGYGETGFEWKYDFNGDCVIDQRDKVGLRQAGVTVP